MQLSSSPLRFGTMARETMDVISRTYIHMVMAFGHRRGKRLQYQTEDNSTKTKDNRKTVS